MATYIWREIYCESTPKGIIRTSTYVRNANKEEEIEKGNLKELSLLKVWIALFLAPQKVG